MRKKLLFLSVILSLFINAKGRSEDTDVQHAQLQSIEDYLQNGDPEKAFVQATAYQKAYPNDIRGEELCHKASQAFNTKQSSDIVEPLGCVLSGPSADRIFEDGTRLFHQKQYVEAQKKFQRIMVSEYPNSLHSGDAYFYNAECYFLLNNLDQIDSAYKAFYTTFPENQFVTSALLHYGEVLIREHKFNDLGEIENLLQKRRAADPSARAALSELLKMTPGDFSSPIFLTDKGKALFEKGDYSSARKYFARTVHSFPDDPDYPDDLYYQAECDRLMGHPKEAAAAYKELIEKYPDYPGTKEARTHI